MSIASDMVTLYVTAEKAVLAGKTYAFGDRSWSLENLAEIRAGRAEWERRLAAEQQIAAGGRASGYALAVFGKSCR